MACPPVDFVMIRLNYFFSRIIQISSKDVKKNKTERSGVDLGNKKKKQDK
jgi:hypothetical protein